MYIHTDCYLTLQLHIIRDLRSDEGDGNENFIKAIGLMSKTTILHMHKAFGKFLCRHCTTTT